MNQKIKNVFSFIKEALELKNKNIYDIKDYIMHYDYGCFYSQFKELVGTPDYSSLNINSVTPFFKLKYIKEENKKEIPAVPENLKDYIFIKDKNDIISKVENLETILDEMGILEDYKEYDKKIKEINRYNDLIDLYNSKYMELYNIYKRINDYEEKIEVVYGQKLLVWQDEKGNKIQRYILEANLEISVDPINNIITLNGDKDKFRGFVTDFLNLDAYKIKDSKLLNDYVKEFNEQIDNDDIDIDKEIIKYINYASLENEVINGETNANETIKLNKTFVFNNSGIFVRNRNVKLWIDDLSKIIGSCDTTNFTSPILNMFEVESSDEEQINRLLCDETYKYTKDEEVLFPLPSNSEQYKIVDKVKNSNIVLVQGPPGTGKSHTIANLISHYIASGKKVIVTSEKAKALEVLRNKIPDKIRNLSLALLTSKGVDRDLENAIESILRHQEDKQELDKIKNRIEKLKDDLKNNYIEKDKVIQTIVELMSKETISHKEKLSEIINCEYTNNLTLMELAIWLSRNKEYSLIPINDTENYSYTNVREFFEKLDDIVDEIRNNKYAISSSVPISEYLKNNNIELYIEERLGLENYQIVNNEIINAIKQTELTEESINRIKEKVDSLSYLYQFFDKEFIIQNITYPVFLNKIKELNELIKNNLNFIIEKEQKLYDFSITINNEDNLDFYCNKLSEILYLYNDNGSINLINKIKKNYEIKNLEGLLYNNKIINKNNIKYKDFIKINDALNYYKLVNLIKLKTFQILNIDLFEKFNIQKNQFGKYMENFVNIFNGFINYKEYSYEIDKTFEKIINTNLFPIHYITDDEKKIGSIIKDLKWYATEKSSDNKTSQIINELRDFYKNYNLQTLNKLLVSIETNNIKEYKDDKNILLREINIINQYNNLKNKYLDFVNDKKELIRSYIYGFDNDKRLFLKDNIDKILKYHYIEKYYLSIEEKVTILPTLYEKREKLINEGKNIISELVATKGWYYQCLNMNYNISTSLNRWISLKRKLGRGTGKNANLYLRQMQEEMKIAKNAIPVWIMPIDKLIEQYPFTNEPPFDVLIMDESSQSSVFSISALARAKKIIIVGDDKQISPTNAFTNIDGINDLRVKYLKNNSWDLQISRDTSIYDIIQTICGTKKITLTEHFRCLPEIINYSNKEFYNMEINPLKIRSKENTIDVPIKTVYVPGAVCKKIGSNLYNKAEIDRIVMLIGEIINDNQYNNKTIGIIILQSSDKYVRKLTELVMQKYGENLINERKIKIGSTYDFQGDERDVIILGMVVSSVLENDQKYSFRALTTQEFDKSFNVAASRAREQMILVHSVTLNELSQNCNRYKLLNYCLNYNNTKQPEYENLFQSNFEKDVYDALVSKNYQLIPQFKVGKYKLDFVLSNDNNQKIAIECDGDIYYDIAELKYNLERQSVLERCGWKFIRIRASEFYYNNEECFQSLLKKIESYLKTDNTTDYKKEAKNDIKENNNNDSFDYTKINVEKLLNHDNEIEFGTSQFKYMVLYSNGVTRKEIADYYKVPYETVKKSLQSISHMYNEQSIDNCTKRFVEKYSDNTHYKNILFSFQSTNKLDLDNRNYINENNNLNLYNTENNERIISIIKHAILTNSKIKISYGDNNIKFTLQVIEYCENNGNPYIKAKDLMLSSFDSKKIKSFIIERINDVNILL
ncbi:MAG: AAA family ATPase [Bacilli bacterium]|nr:AAA family ATPase [Bacilli bacterium]